MKILILITAFNVNKFLQNVINRILNQYLVKM